MSRVVFAHWLRCAGWVMAACLSTGAAWAQETRDPTVPPTSASVELRPEQAAYASLGMQGMSVIVRDGKPGLVVGTRVVLPGQRVGAWTLERITETEVWLRDGKNTRKIPRFSGIERGDPAARMAACAARNAASAPAPTQEAKGKRKASNKTPPTSTPADTQCDAPPTRSSNP